MEEDLLKIFKLADSLNSKQDKVYAQLCYTANDSKKLEIIIRSKKDFSFIERCELQLSNNPVSKLNNISKLFEIYIGGVINE